VKYFWFDPSERYDPIHICATLDEALTQCKAAIAAQCDNGWNLDEDEMEEFCVGTITHRNVVRKTIATVDDCDALGVAPETEIWECELVEVRQ